MNETPETMRLLLELALNCGKKRKSLQTGYLHYCYHPIEQEPHLPIPVVENFLFALALLRSRTVENIQEAKILIEGLLHFQNKNKDNSTKGNFPVYLHDYPSCKDYFTGIHVACAIYWILKQFHQVLGQHLKEGLEEALILSIKHALHLHMEKNPSYPISIKIAAAAIAAGRFVGDEQLKDYGLQLLEVLRANPDDAYFYCPSSLGSISASLLMVYPRISESPWKFFWDHLQKTWHRHTASYVGPSLKEWQQGAEPQVTLYDLVCGCFSGAFSDRVLKEAFILLEAVLIPISEERFESLNYPLEIQGSILHGGHHGVNWFLHHGERVAYSFIQKKMKETNPVVEKGFHPFKLLWGDIHRAHTFVCQGGTAAEITFAPTELFFDLEGTAEVEEKEKSREILFFLDAHEDLEFLISGQKASTFVFGDEVTIKDKDLSLTLSFNLEEGEGRFLGHRMLGNRPSQQGVKGRARFNAYDWQVFLRTIHREHKCRFKVRLQIHDAQRS